MDLDLTKSTEARDRGAALAEDNAGPTWNKRAIDIALSFFRAAGEEGALFEDVRAYAEMRGLSRPPSPNAWGAVALAMSRYGLVVRTGVYRKSRAVRSHARQQPVWKLA